jgi:hypothetical protein
LTALEKVHLSREARDCASSFVIAAYLYVRLFPHDSHALHLKLFTVPSPLATSYEVIILLLRILGWFSEDTSLLSKVDASFRVCRWAAEDSYEVAIGKVELFMDCGQSEKKNNPSEAAPKRYKSRFLNDRAGEG